ncbi:MAG TPA: hypothetical protein ENI23_00735 [bacterium]|nr:hypothetical protein [bacterium]
MSNLKLSKIPYITLWAFKFDEMKKFYIQTLGLPVIEESKNFIQFKTEGTLLYIHRSKESRPLRKETIEIHFDVEDVDQTAKSLKDKGVKFETEPQNMPWGNRLAAFRDPEGYTIELVGPIKKGEPIVEHPQN